MSPSSSGLIGAAGSSFLAQSANASNSNERVFGKRFVWMTQSGNVVLDSLRNRTATGSSKLRIWVLKSNPILTSEDSVVQHSKRLNEPSFTSGHRHSNTFLFRL